MRLKHPEYRKNNRLQLIELNFGLKFVINVIIDLILATKNYDFALERIYHLLLTMDINKKIKLDSEKISTTILVLKNIMDSIKPMIKTICYIYTDIFEPNDWDPF